MSPSSGTKNFSDSHVLIFPEKEGQRRFGEGLSVPLDTFFLCGMMEQVVDKAVE